MLCVYIYICIYIFFFSWPWRSWTMVVWSMKDWLIIRFGSNTKVVPKFMDICNIYASPANMLSKLEITGISSTFFDDLCRSWRRNNPHPPVILRILHSVGYPQLLGKPLAPILIPSQDQFAAANGLFDNTKKGQTPGTLLGKGAILWVKRCPPWTTDANPVVTLQTNHGGFAITKYYKYSRVGYSRDGECHYILGTRINDWKQPVDTSRKT